MTHFGDEPLEDDELQEASDEISERLLLIDGSKHGLLLAMLVAQFIEAMPAPERDSIHEEWVEVMLNARRLLRARGHA